jgi:hypothetical protein
VRAFDQFTIGHGKQFWFARLQRPDELRQGLILPRLTQPALPLEAPELAAGRLPVSQEPGVKAGLALNLEFNLFLVQLRPGYPLRWR